MQMISVGSSAINAVGYDPVSMQLHIRFKQGHTYIFCRVPQNIYDGLMSASSKGSYYDSHIRERYHC
jgi:hypothetical protein